MRGKRIRRATEFIMLQGQGLEFHMLDEILPES